MGQSVLGSDPDQSAWSTTRVRSLLGPANFLTNEN